jgi:hypothetical protein
LPAPTNCRASLAMNAIGTDESGSRQEIKH